MATIRRHTSILSQTSLLYPQPEIDRASSNRSPNSRIPPMAVAPKHDKRHRKFTNPSPIDKFQRAVQISLSGNEDFQIRSSLKFSAVPRLVYPLRIQRRGGIGPMGYHPSSIITRDTKTFISVYRIPFPDRVSLSPSLRNSFSRIKPWSTSGGGGNKRSSRGETLTLCWSSSLYLSLSFVRLKTSFRWVGWKDRRKIGDERRWVALDDATPLVRASGRRDAGSHISLPLCRRQKSNRFAFLRRKSLWKFCARRKVVSIHCSRREQ